MKALVYTGVEEMEFREEKEPSEKPGESILKVHASGICGSDMHAYHGKDERRIPPLILGHEVSGQIINGKLKDQISVLNPLITCRNCEYCKSGREHLCPDRVLLGMNRPYERQGAFAELITVPDHNIFKVPEKLDVKEAARIPPNPDAKLENSDEAKGDKNPLLKVVESVMAYEDSDGIKLAQPFWKLPSKKKLPEYYKVIQSPMDIARIQDKVEQAEYTTLAAFEKDFTLVWENARKYNKEDSAIFQV